MFLHIAPEPTRDTCVAKTMVYWCNHCEKEETRTVTEKDRLNEKSKKATFGREIKVEASVDSTTSVKECIKIDFPRFVVYDKADSQSSQAIRMIFEHSLVPYERMIITEDQEEEMRKTLPTLSYPVLEIDGVKLAGIGTICRNLGWRFELSGRNAMEDSLVDMWGEALVAAGSQIKPFIDRIEYRQQEGKAMSDSDASRILDTNIAPSIEAALRKSQSCWLVGHTMTWADILCALLFNPIIYHRPRLLEKYPLIYLHSLKVAEVPAFEPYLYKLKQRSDVA